MALLATAARAADLVVRREGANLVVQVDGDGDNDWRLEASPDLLSWSAVTNFGTLIGGKPAVAPWRMAGVMTNSAGYFRAVKTGGLYDPSLFRAVSFTFTQANWSTLLANARQNGSNVYCSLLTLDNGATNRGVGARYKGNTSYVAGGNKKSFNVEVDWPTGTNDLMGYSTFNLNNAAGDETIMREAIYFTVMSRYTPCPKASMARVYANGGFWGVYTLVQQENGQLISEWFPSNNGDRWRTPNAPVGGFSSSNSALSYLGSTNVITYQSHYDLRTTNSASATAWRRLIDAIVALNTTPAAQWRDRIEDYLAVDRWLWFLAIENVFADDDSYFNKGADYSFYYEIESGRIHPIEHDGNEAFVAGDVSLSPVFGVATSNRPVLQRFLGNNELKQRYLAHMRTVLQESFNPAALTPFIDQLRAMSQSAIAADTNKNFTMLAYTNDVMALKTFITNRHGFLNNHAELRPVAPSISAVIGPSVAPTALDVPWVTAQVTNGADGVESVWLYHRGRSYGRFAVAQMQDDGAHGDGLAGDGIYGAATTNYPAGTKVRYYVEARSGNAVRTAAFSPAHAEQDTHSYRVAVTTAARSSVIINEVMAANGSTLADPQGEFDDWIELRNLSDAPVDMSGRYLSDEPNNPRKWAFPAGTVLPPNGYLIVWADEDGLAAPGLHASFKLSAAGEEVFLTDTDAKLNAILDQVAFGLQETDRSYARTAADADVWMIGLPTPGTDNP